MQAITHVNSVRAGLGQPDAAVLFQTEPTQTCRWCAQQPPANKQPLTCANCHRIIVAEEGDTCANIPAWQRGRFDYCDRTVPKRAPEGMLAVRVGSDPWTMIPLDS